MNEKPLITNKKVLRLFARRQNIIQHNNNYILDTMIFYEMFFLRYIIEPYLFNQNYQDNLEIREFFEEKMTFMDSFKIVYKIAKSNGIKKFKKIDKLLKIRNKISHNVSSVGLYNRETKEHEIVIGGLLHTWDTYLELIKEWADLSYELADFTLEVYKVVHKNPEYPKGFNYCSVVGECVLKKEEFYYPEINDNLFILAKEELSNEMLVYIQEEKDFREGKVII